MNDNNQDLYGSEDAQQNTEERPFNPAEALLAEGPQAPKKKETPFWFDVLEMFVWSVFVVLILFTFVIRICRVDGQSMENTLWDGEKLLVYSLSYTPKQDDIVIFHLTQEEDNLEKTVVKRVIAVEGQVVEIDFNTGAILIDGEHYPDHYAVLKDRVTGEKLGYYTLFAEHGYNAAYNTFKATVPEGHVFVMGDNRNNSRDSRDREMGFIDTRCILGKAIVRLSPFTVFS